MKPKLLPALALAACLAAPLPHALSQDDPEAKPPKPRSEETPKPERKPQPKADLKRERDAQAEADPRPVPPSPPRAPRLKSPGTPAERQAWLGVATAGIAPALREHLELEEGFGVQIDHVAEGSPAEQAGLRPRDILVRLDDQRLISPEHLAILVRSKQEGDRVALAIIRRGAEEILEAVLGETETNPWTRPGSSIGFKARSGPGEADHWEFRGEFGGPMAEKTEQWLEAAREYQDRLREWMERNQPQRFPRRQGDAGATTPGDPQPVLPLPEGGEPEASAPPQPESIRGPRSTGRPPALSVRPGFPIEIFGGPGLIRIDNQEGEVTIQEKEGQHRISIVNADGETVYQGDYDPGKGPEALPREARDHLEKMKLDDLRILGLPRPASGQEEPDAKIETSAPAETTPAPAGEPL